MAGYNEIRGLRVRYLSADPSNAENGQVWYNSTTGNLRVQGIGIEAFSSATPLPVAKSTYHRAGTMTAGLFCAGNTSTGFSTTTEEWNGLGFSQGGAIGTSLYANTGFGTQTAGVSAAGRPTNPTSGDTAATFEYDGSTWTSVNAANTAARRRQSFGILTAGAMVGGFQQSTTAYTNATEEYDGTNWTTVTAMPVNTASPNCMGTQTAAIVTASGAPTVNTNVIAYDGTNWTSSPSMNIARISSAAGGTGATNTAGLLIGGGPYSPTATATAEKWDGTSFSNSPASLTTARYGAGLSDGNTNGMMVGGYQGTAFQSIVEEFNSSTNTITAAAWSSGGNLNTGRELGGNAGTSTAGLLMSGKIYPNTFKNETEEYNGSSWSEQNNVSTARATSGAGTQTAGIIFGGTNGAPGSTGVQTATEEYDGSSWTNGGALSTARLGLYGAGLQTACFGAGGTNSSNSPVTTVEDYNGTSWTAGTAIPTAQQGGGAAGLPSARLVFAGYAPYANFTVEGDGEGWTAGGNMLDARGQLAGFGSQTDALACAGSTSPPNVDTTAVEGYDGTSWSTRPSLSTERMGLAPGGSYNTTTGGMVVGGSDSGNPMRNQTEEWNAETSVANTSNITTS